MAFRTEDYLQSIVRELTKLPFETEWAEFKCNTKDPERTAKYISGLSNSAKLCDKPFAYLVWGIDDSTHKIVGTSFNYHLSKKGNEELEAWLNHEIVPKINFKFYDVNMPEGKKVVLLEIPCAENEPTKFRNQPYIRIGSNLKCLTEYKDKEAELWRAFDSTPFELRIAESNVKIEDIGSRLDLVSYFNVVGIPYPGNMEDIADALSKEKFIRHNSAGNWDITNLGALMIAKDLESFDNLNRRPIRVIWYKGNDRLATIKEKVFSKGYIIDYEDIMEYLMTIIPQEEIIEGPLRKSLYGYPEIALRELLANIMVHQALDQRGTNPMVELFSERIEFSNPGAPLIAIDRIIDTVPVSRNENLAGFMHRCGICEERGSGFDKVVDSTCKNCLIAPLVENQNNQFTKVVLFKKVPFEIITKEDRIRTCYMLACLAYINFSAISNSDVRRTFGLEDNKVKASRIIKDTLKANRIKLVDEKASDKNKRYVPIWA